MIPITSQFLQELSHASAFGRPLAFINFTN